MFLPIANAARSRALRPPAGRARRAQPAGPTRRPGSALDWLRCPLPARLGRPPLLAPPIHRRTRPVDPVQNPAPAAPARSAARLSGNPFPFRVPLTTLIRSGLAIVRMIITLTSVQGQAQNKRILD